MASAPAHLDAERGERGLYEPGCDECARPDCKVAIHQQVCLSLACEHSVGQRHAAYREDDPAEHGLRDGPLPHAACKFSRCPTRYVEGPSCGTPDEGGGYDQCGFERAHFHPREARQAHSSPKYISEQQKRRECACNGAQVDKGFLRARQLDVDVAFAVFGCVRRPCERGHKAVQGGGEQGG